MKAALRTGFALAALLGAFASMPSFARAMEDEAGKTIKCEKCSCNLNTGVCDCTNCTIVQS
jgi:hypothetical protein